MNKLRHSLSVFYGSVKVSVLEQLEYPSYLICWIIGIPIQYLAGIGMVISVSKQFGSLGGYNYGELIFLYGLGLISQALMVVFFIQTWNIDRMVINGDLDRMLLRPVNIIFQFCTNYINFIGFIDLIPGSVIFIYGCKVIGFQWTISNVLKLIGVIFGAVIIRASFFTLLGSISFWAKGSRALVKTGEIILQKTSMYPISMYPVLFQMIFTFIIPLGFISFYPSADFLGKRSGFTFSLGFAVLTPIVGLAMGALSMLIFKIGIRRYESSGT